MRLLFPIILMMLLSSCGSKQETNHVMYFSPSDNESESSGWEKFYKSTHLRHGDTLNLSGYFHYSKEKNYLTPTDQITQGFGITLIFQESISSDELELLNGIKVNVSGIVDTTDQKHPFKKHLKVLDLTE